VAENVRDVQSFHPPPSVRDFKTVTRITLTSTTAPSHSFAFTASRISNSGGGICGREEESRARQDLNVQASMVHTDALNHLQILVVRRTPKKAHPLPLLQAARLQIFRTNVSSPCRLKVWEITFDTVLVHRRTLIPPLSRLLPLSLLSLRTPILSKPLIIPCKDLTCLSAPTQLCLLLWHHHLYLLHPAQ